MPCGANDVEDSITAEVFCTICTSLSYRNYKDRAYISELVKIFK